MRDQQAASRQFDHGGGISDPQTNPYKPGGYVPPAPVRGPSYLRRNIVLAALLCAVLAIPFSLVLIENVFFLSPVQTIDGDYVVVQHSLWINIEPFGAMIFLVLYFGIGNLQVYMARRSLRSQSVQEEGSNP
jgi:hypothetical protein